MRAWKRGALPFARGSVLRLAPPLCIDAAQVDELAEIVCACIEELQDELSAARKDRVSASTGAA